MDGFRPALKTAIITSSLSMPELVEVVTNIFGKVALDRSVSERSRTKERRQLSGGKDFIFQLYKYNFVPMCVVFVMIRRRAWMGTSIWTKSLACSFVFSRCCLKHVSAWKRFRVVYFWLNMRSEYFPQKCLKKALVLLLFGSTFFKTEFHASC